MENIQRKMNRLTITTPFCRLHWIYSNIVAVSYFCIVSEFIIMSAVIHKQTVSVYSIGQMNT